MIAARKLHGLTGPERATGAGRRRDPYQRRRAAPVPVAADPDAPSLSDRALALAIAYHAAVRVAYLRGLATRADVRAARTRLRRVADRVDLRSGTISRAEVLAGWAEDAASGLVLRETR